LGIEEGPLVISDDWEMSDFFRSVASGLPFSESVEFESCSFVAIIVSYSKAADTIAISTTTAIGNLHCFIK